METSREPITSTPTVFAILLVLSTLTYIGAIAVGVSFALRAIQTLLSLPCAMHYVPRSLPCA
jgi:hypothetical protein